MNKLLRVEAPHFVAGLEFEKKRDGWRCVNAAPIMKYCKDMKPEAIRDYLIEKGWKFEWVESM